MHPATDGRGGRGQPRDTEKSADALITSMAPQDASTSTRTAAADGMRAGKHSIHTLRNESSRAGLPVSTNMTTLREPVLSAPRDQPPGMLRPPVVS